MRAPTSYRELGRRQKDGRIFENQIRKDKIRPDQPSFSCLVVPASSRAVADKGVPLAELQQDSTQGGGKEAEAPSPPRD